MRELVPGEALMGGSGTEFHGFCAPDHLAPRSATAYLNFKYDLNIPW